MPDVSPFRDFLTFEDGAAVDSQPPFRITTDEEGTVASLFIEESVYRVFEPILKLAYAANDLIVIESAPDLVESASESINYLLTIGEGGGFGIAVSLIAVARYLADRAISIGTFVYERQSTGGTLGGSSGFTLGGEHGATLGGGSTIMQVCERDCV